MYIIIPSSHLPIRITTTQTKTQYLYLKLEDGRALGVKDGIQLLKQSGKSCHLLATCEIEVDFRDTVRNKQKGKKRKKRNSSSRPCPSLFCPSKPSHVQSIHIYINLVCIKYLIPLLFLSYSSMSLCVYRCIVR